MKKIIVIMSCLILAVIFRMNLSEYNEQLQALYLNLEPVRTEEYKSLKMTYVKLSPCIHSQCKLRSVNKTWNKSTVLGIRADI